MVAGPFGEGQRGQPSTSGTASTRASERMRIFADGLARIQQRLAVLRPPPLCDVPVLIGGSGERKTLPLVGRYASIWHSFLDLETFLRKSALVAQYAQKAGRDNDRIERAITRTTGSDADAFLDQGVTLWTTEVKAAGGHYDLTTVEEMLAWRSKRT